MDIEIIVKSIGLLASVVAVYKVAVEVILTRSSKHREEYQFVKNYLQDLYSPDSNRFALEKGFRAITGDTCSVEEIKYLLTFEFPSRAITLRSYSRKFLEFDASKGYLWIGKFESENSRKYAPAVYATGYMVFAFIALFPLIYSGIHIAGNWTVLILSVAFGVLAIGCLINHENVKSAEKLIKMRPKEFIAPEMARDSG